MITVGILMALGFNRSSIISVIAKACSCSGKANQTDLITAFKIFMGLLDVDPNQVFLPPPQCGLRGDSYKALQGKSHHQLSGSAFSVRVAKPWNRLLASVVTAPPANILKKRLEKVYTEAFPHLPH